MRRMLHLIYSAAKRAHGVRGWWPVFSSKAGLAARPVYDPRRSRLTPRQRFEIAVGAILTQNTAWTNVEKAMIALHRKRVLSVEALRSIPRPTLAKLIRSSGYFNQKSKRLKGFIRFLDLEFSGRSPLENMRRLPPSVARRRLLGVSGIGPETADSILLYAFEKPVFVIDAYTRRIFSRHGWIEGTEPYDEIRMWFEKNLPRSAKLFNDYHAQIVEIGKRHCHRRRPECLSCPLYRRGFFASAEDFHRVVS